MFFKPQTNLKERAKNRLSIAIQNCSLMSRQQQLLNQILPVIYSVKEDEEKLQKILTFLIDEIYDELDESFEIPEKYKEIVKDIAEKIDCGLVCFLNPDTMEMEEVDPNFINDPEEYEAITGEKYEGQFQNSNWENCIEIEPLESSESFQIMEQFVDEIEDKKLQNKLISALKNRKPFSHFKQIIDNSEYREYWFKFKQRKLEELVWDALSFELEENDSDYHEEINGIYNDDGTMVDLKTIPVPGLCVVCKKYQTEDWDENLLCQMIRNDQKDEDSFECGAFDKIG